jgi:hypothetical protein
MPLPRHTLTWGDPHCRAVRPAGFPDQAERQGSFKEVLKAG